MMEDKELLAFGNGFLACVVYSYYMSLSKEEQELWCEEWEERVVEQYSYLFEDYMNFEIMRKG